MDATVNFTKLIQDSQEWGSDTEHMVSRVFFSLNVDGTNYPDLSCDVKQTVGSEFESAPLEVSNPTGYRGPFNHAAFRVIVEKYFRHLVGSTGVAFQMGPGSRNIRMYNGTFEMPATASFEIDPDNRSW